MNTLRDPPSRARSTGTTAPSVKEANALLLGLGIALNKTEFATTSLARARAVDARLAGVDRSRAALLQSRRGDDGAEGRAER